MNCSTCQRMNLSGGVRCAYCGTPLPPAPDFELGFEGVEGAPASSGPPDATAGTDAGGPAPRRVPAGLLGVLLLLLLKAKSLLALVKFGKLAATLGSMFVFIWADAKFFGWKFGVGLAVCILVHELGHVFVNWRKGLKQSAPMFIPFVGAVIAVKQFPEDPTVESESGAGGPTAGLLAALVCALVAALTGSRYWLALAYLGFALNLFNLIPLPFLPLDGVRIASVFSPATWDFVLVSLLLWVLKVPSPMLWVVLIVGCLFRLGQPAHGRYLLATPAVRVRMALLYLGLCLALGYGVQHSGTMHPLYESRAVEAGERGEKGREGERRGEKGTEEAKQLESRGAGEQEKSPASSLPRSPSPFASLPSWFLWVLRGFLWGAATLGWLLTALLLAVSAGQRMGVRGLALAGWMSGAWGGLYGVCYLFEPLEASEWTLVGAGFAALGAALTFAAYHAVKAQGRSARFPRSWLTWRGLAWAGAGALGVAYYADNGWVLLAVALGAVVFYARWPWLLPSLAARLCENLGQLERAIALRHRALALRPDPENAVSLWHSIAHSHLALGRGEPALAALDAAASLPAHPPPTSFSALAMEACRVYALIRLDRFDEALSHCERMLRAPEGDLAGSWRLLLVHGLLGEMALYRGWPDEALAQADWVRHAMPPTAAAHRPLRSPIASTHGARAAAQVAAGQIAEARAGCDQALRWSREPIIEAAMALVRAQASLKEYDPRAAEREAAAALRRLPGSLEARYWRGRALDEMGRRAEGEALLRALAEEWPREHWGRLARSATEGSAAA